MTLRGRTVGLVFAHQGWGNFAFTLIYAFLLTVTGVGGCSTNIAGANMTIAANEAAFVSNCNLAGLEITWRLTYAFGVIPVLMLVFYRFRVLAETKLFTERRAKYNAAETRVERTERWNNLKIIFTNRAYLIRLIGAGGTWYLQDVAFYGNKLFQGAITASIIGNNNSGNVSLLANAQFTALVGFVALTGYYLASFTIDYPWMGRVRLQNIGFLLTGLFYLLCGGLYATLSTKQIPAFEFLYLAASFFQQYGPNVVTWLLPVELFPTDIRGQAQGFCAATGKTGALTAALLFTYVPVFNTNKATGGASANAANIFWCCGAIMIAGLVLTILAVPDVTKVNLASLDRRFSVDRRARLVGGS